MMNDKVTPASPVIKDCDPKRGVKKNENIKSANDVTANKNVKPARYIAKDKNVKPASDLKGE